MAPEMLPNAIFIALILQRTNKGIVAQASIPFGVFDAYLQSCSPTCLWQWCLSDCRHFLLMSRLSLTARLSVHDTMIKAQPAFFVAFLWFLSMLQGAGYSPANQVPVVAARN